MRPLGDLVRDPLADIAVLELAVEASSPAASVRARSTAGRRRRIAVPDLRLPRRLRQRHAGERRGAGGDAGRLAAGAGHPGPTATSSRRGSAGRRCSRAPGSWRGPRLIGMAAQADQDESAAACLRAAGAAALPGLAAAGAALSRALRLHRGGRGPVLRPRGVHRRARRQARGSSVHGGGRPLGLGQVVGGAGRAGAAAAGSRAGALRSAGRARTRCTSWPRAWRRCSVRAARTPRGARTAGRRTGARGCAEDPGRILDLARPRATRGPGPAGRFW